MSIESDVFREAAKEGASALKYRAERLRGFTTADDEVARELIEKWTQLAAVLAQFGAS